jgi:Protein of unknown function (DUF1580)
VINANEEALVSLAEAAAMVPGRQSGKAIAVSTIYRWSTWGTDGVRLETVQVGARTLTSKQALDRFFAALTEKRAQAFGEPAPRTRRRGQVAATTTRTAKRQAEIDAAMELARAELAPRSRP